MQPFRNRLQHQLFLASRPTILPVRVACVTVKWQARGYDWAATACGVTAEALLGFTPAFLPVPEACVAIERQCRRRWWQSNDVLLENWRCCGSHWTRYQDNDDNHCHEDDEESRQDPAPVVAAAS
eukprot:CAMPEP_0197650830 /NCGR_PEP_ID=MMETSP1338-20131121/31182_1 /TAXON_ID=43686 ORGANISM="Pelagodinium beii, Strain RCC1491" /NCGR_SAMPLE_ID=MMETSP1338 /ASSEMBLY_ACC=CAM_ASM_000754 /LENGTH=124 /DNA_ID=CAMNT_0043225315 /DNA_START=96 /DNA_END=469 /DNA_ORIENTATION=+